MTSKQTTHPKLFEAPKKFCVLVLRCADILCGNILFLVVWYGGGGGGGLLSQRPQSTFFWGGFCRRKAEIIMVFVFQLRNFQKTLLVGPTMWFICCCVKTYIFWRGWGGGLSSQRPQSTVLVFGFAAGKPKIPLFLSSSGKKKYHGVASLSLKAKHAFGASSAKPRMSLSSLVFREEHSYDVFEVLKRRTRAILSFLESQRSLDTMEKAGCFGHLQEFSFLFKNMYVYTPIYVHICMYIYIYIFFFPW